MQTIKRGPWWISLQLSSYDPFREEPEVQTCYRERPDLGRELPILIARLDGCFPPLVVRNL